MQTDEASSQNAALVTGASRGIGRAIALRLGRCGHDVAVNYLRSGAEAEAVTSQIRQMGRRAIAVQCDVSEPGAAAALIDTVENELGRVDVLVSNAGITRDKLLIQMSEDDWFATWNTNLAGPRVLCRSAISRMRDRRYGRVVTVGSVVGPLGNAGQVNYAAAKAALAGLTRELAVTAATSRITVNCVVPGYIMTDAVAHLSDGQVASWYDRIPMRLQGLPEDVAELVVFLAGPGARYITGQCIAIDGGLLARAGAGFQS